MTSTLHFSLLARPRASVRNVLFISLFFQQQEKILASAGYDSSTYGQAVYVPAAADRAVLAL